jgi:hypothetical protein
MLLSGFGYLYAPDGSFIETANEAFARMAVLATLRKYPEIMDSDDTAEDLFHLLDPEAQTRLAAEANVAPAKVVGKEIASSLLVSTGMIQATLKVSKQGALNLVGELNLREITGRGSFERGGLFDPQSRQQGSITLTKLSNLTNLHSVSTLGGNRRLWPWPLQSAAIIARPRRMRESRP